MSSIHKILTKTKFDFYSTQTSISFTFLLLLGSLGWNFEEKKRENNIKFLVLISCLISKKIREETLIHFVNLWDKFGRKFLEEFLKERKLSNFLDFLSILDFGGKEVKLVRYLIFLSLSLSLIDVWCYRR